MKVYAQKQPRQQVSPNLTRPVAKPLAASHVVRPIVHLQRTIGNQAVRRILQTQAEMRDGDAATAASPRCGHNFSRVPLHPLMAGAVQAKRMLNELGDKYEQEADRVAEQVMNIAGPSLVQPNMQHQTAPAEPARQRVGQGDGFKAGQRLERLPGGSQGGGRPLPDAARSFMEPRFGFDFSQVRIHTDAQADRSARALNAEAYTVGTHIVFRQGRAAINTLAGIRLLAHELTHVVQQNTLRPPGNSSGSAPAHAQREAPRTEPDWHQKLDEILPRQVGLLTVIDRVTMLINIFGEGLLQQHVELIHADSAARGFTQGHGVPGVVALYDTRRGNQLDVTAAQQALTSLPDRYKRAALESLRLIPRQEAPPSYWFQDPASQQRPAPGGLTTGIGQRAQVHIEGQLSQVGSDIFVRFAYPATEVSSSGASRRIEGAKQSILQALAGLVVDLGSLPPAADIQERREQQTVRARLSEALRGLGRSAPLNVYISSEPTPEELMTGQVAALADRIYVSLQDVGDPTRLQAAIRAPLMMLRGGVLPGQGGAQQVPAASQAALQSTLLHEALHTLLIRQSSDANAIWEAQRAQLIIQGSPSAGPKLVELVRKYLISQEEVFAYENEATLYPPVSPNKASYDLFIASVRSFLSRRGLTLNAVSRSIPVSQRVARRTVTWTITYQMPSGTVDLTVNDIQIIDFLLGTYPLR